MQYVTGQHALNIPCSLITCGDWHQDAIQWTYPLIRESDDSVFGNYGIEVDKSIPEHFEKHCVANHIRAILDLLELGNFILPQGMRDDFICNEDYTEEVFRQVAKLEQSSQWPEIDRFMGKEYLSTWLDYKQRKGI